MKYKIKNRILAIGFIIIIAGVFFCNMKSVASILYNAATSYNGIKSTIATIESQYNSQFFQRRKYIELNGITHKALNQKMMNGAVVSKDKNMFAVDTFDYNFDEKKEKIKSDKAVEILSYAKKQGIDTLYVQRPWHLDTENDKLPYGFTLDYNKQYDYWISQMKSNNIQTLDLRSTMKGKLEFYKTDHHWTVETSYLASNEILKKLSILYDINVDKKIMNIENYSLDTYEKSFLGSLGVKTGEIYAGGKEDFSILIPKFDTNLTLNKYVKHKLELRKNGNFSSAFINKEILEDNTFYNKFTACIYDGFDENIIVNNNANNNLKVLLIADSYGKPMTQYFSLAFKETRYLDPQEGRYNDSFIEYIREYKPDIVVMMFPGYGDFKVI